MPTKKSRKQNNKFQIAVDGGAATGKSTTSKLIAKKLHFVYCDTGALYRCAGLTKLHHPDYTDQEILKSMRVDFKPGKTQQVYLNHANVTTIIRGPKVSDMASKISVHPEIRKGLTEKARQIAGKHNVVMDGRDVGTTILPHADFKLFFVTNLRVRAKRRYKDLAKIGTYVPLHKLEQSLKARDFRDSHRKTSPLKPAKGAIIIDNSKQTSKQTAKFVCKRFKWYDQFDQLPHSHGYEAKGLKWFYKLMRRPWISLLLLQPNPEITKKHPLLSKVVRNYSRTLNLILKTFCEAIVVILWASIFIGIRPFLTTFDYFLIAWAVLGDLAQCSLFHRIDNRFRKHLYTLSHRKTWAALLWAFDIIFGVLGIIFTIYLTLKVVVILIAYPFVAHDALLFGVHCLNVVINFFEGIY